MSNYKTTLQSNNESLSSNNIDLQSLIDQANALPDAAGGEQATPVITVNNSNGLITATAGTKTSTHQLAFQAAKTITPTTTSQIAVYSGYYTGGNITVAGDSNLVAGNIKSGVSIFGVNGNYVGSGGDTSMEDGLVTRTITIYTNDRVTKIGKKAFKEYDILTSVNFPACTEIGYSAFEQCFDLRSVNFPACTEIKGNAFDYCPYLSSINFPACTKIGYDAFYSCGKLTSVNFPACTEINYYAFGKCTSLKSASFPACTYIGSSAFQKCYALSSITLGASTVCTLKASNAFISTPYKGYSASFSGTPYIYVPASLINSYKTATNWTYFSSYFSTIESLGG